MFRHMRSIVGSRAVDGAPGRSVAVGSIYAPGMAPLPMFPLGTVLLPSVYLPLHVFEPRYRELVQVCLDGNQEFGVVLIERGSEVGGGDQRVDVGTVAQIVEATRMPDGRWALGAVGTRRIRVRGVPPGSPVSVRAVNADPVDLEMGRRLLAHNAFFFFVSVQYSPCRGNGFPCSAGRPFV